MADSIKALVLPALKLTFEDGKHDEALALLDEILGRILGRETRCAVHAYRSMVSRNAGRWADELRDLETAHDLSTPDSYRRYGIELGLAMNADQRGDAETKARWAARAERTLRAVPIHEREDRGD